MDVYESLSHSVWVCKYHVVFIPKYRRKALRGELRRHLGEVFRALVKLRESDVEEGHLMPDHVHTLTSIPGPDVLRPEAELRRASPLGAGVLRFDRGARGA